MTTRFLNSIASALCLAGLTLSASAQKLPDVQESPLAAPANIKVDGKNKEWNDTFQALNKRTNVYYTIANDDDNLYFAFKSADATAGAKILAGGITVGVNPDGKKKEKERISMTYPIVPRPNFGGGGQGNGRRMAMGSVITVAAPSRGGGGGGNMPSAKQMDSAMVVMQRKRLALVKEIRISGFKNTTDTLVSIYNEHGIKAFSSIGSDNTFFCEMAIPLAELGLTKDHAKEFLYNIKLNGLQMGGGLDGGSFSGVIMGGGGRQHAGGMSGVNFQDLLSPTDFWGKYTLVKK